METILGIDVSGYQDPHRVNYAELKAHGFGFAVVKLDQYLTDEHVTHARASGLEVGGYYWNDPLSTSTYQAARIISECNRLGLRFAWLDTEQWWSDWGLWYKAVTNVIPWSDVPKFTQRKISDSSRQVLEMVKPQLNIPWGLYTGKWFPDQYALPMYEWVENWQTWLAQYVSKKGAVTWDYLSSLPGSNHLVPLGTPKIWQMSGSFVYPGRSSWDCYDTNVFLGTQDDLTSWLRYPPPPPGFTPYDVVSTAADGLRVRAKPNIYAAIITKLFPYHGAVTILEEAKDNQGYTWGRYLVGWIRLDWTRKV